MRFHVLGIPHTISTPEYSTCAFTQKVVKLCTMLKMEGHYVIHYGHVDSKVDCDEHVTVVSRADIRKSYLNHNWRVSGWPQFKKSDFCYQAFYARTPAEIRARMQPHDFLLCSFGDFHKPIADAIPQVVAVEPGIGYPNGMFAKFKVFESYAMMSAFQTNNAALTESNTFWYDAVIPNAFRNEEFDFSAVKKDYFLFLGRVNTGKGIHIATDLAKRVNVPLIVAGPGKTKREDGLITYLGNVGPERRRALLRDARATICASTFLEPFCGVQIESYLSGTPVISTDWGAFSEYNIHHHTGFRCKTMEHFVWAANNIHRIKPNDCRKWGEHFTLEAVAPRYTEYFNSVADIFNGSGGFYATRDDRKSLYNASNCNFRD